MGMERERERETGIRRHHSLRYHSRADGLITAAAPSGHSTGQTHSGNTDWHILYMHTQTAQTCLHTLQLLIYSATHFRFSLLESYSNNYKYTFTQICEYVNIYIYLYEYVLLQCIMQRWYDNKKVTLFLITTVGKYSRSYLLYASA